MKRLLASVAFFFLGAFIAWALCVFVLRLHWEISLLVIQLSAVGSSVGAFVILHRRAKKPR